MAAARDVIERQRTRSFNGSWSLCFPPTNKLATADRNLTYIFDSRTTGRMFSCSPPSCFFLFSPNSRFFFFLFLPNCQIMFGIWRPQTRTHGLITLDADYVGGRQNNIYSVYPHHPAQFGAAGRVGGDKKCHFQTS